MFFFFLFFHYAVTDFFIDSQVLTKVTSTDSTITVPPIVASIDAGAFTGINANLLNFAYGSELRLLNPGCFRDASFNEVIFPPNYVYSCSEMFKNMITLQKVTYLGNCNFIHREAFSMCISFNTFIISDVPVLADGVLNFRGTKVADILENAFRDVNFHTLILSSEIVNPWQFTFGGHLSLRSITVDAPIHYFSQGMFAGLDNLFEIFNDGEAIFQDGVLNLLSLVPSNPNVQNVFAGVPVTTVILDDSVNWTQSFFACMPNLRTAYFHGPCTLR